MWCANVPTADAPYSLLTIPNRLNAVVSQHAFRFLLFSFRVVFYSDLYGNLIWRRVEQITCVGYCNDFTVVINRCRLHPCGCNVVSICGRCSPRNTALKRVTNTEQSMSAVSFQQPRLLIWDTARCYVSQWSLMALLSRPDKAVSDRMSTWMQLLWGPVVMCALFHVPVVTAIVCVPAFWCIMKFSVKFISGTSRAIFTKFFMHVAYGRGLFLLRRRCDTLCTSDFVDDIMFRFCNGPYSGINFATKDRFRLKLLIYCKVRQNSISYY